VLHVKLLHLKRSTFHDSSTLCLACINLGSQVAIIKLFFVMFLNDEKSEAACNVHHSKTKPKTWSRQTSRTSILRSFNLDWCALTYHQLLTGNQRTADDSLCCKLEGALLALQPMDLFAGIYSRVGFLDDLPGDSQRCVQ
jgi:hypothetical protein